MRLKLKTRWQLRPRLLTVALVAIVGAMIVLANLTDEPGCRRSRADDLVNEHCGMALVSLPKVGNNFAYKSTRATRRRVRDGRRIITRCVGEEPNETNNSVCQVVFGVDSRPRSHLSISKIEVIDVDTAQALVEAMV